MTTRGNKGSVDRNRQSGRNTDKDMKLLMSLIDPTAMEARAKNADKGIGYVELSSETKQKLLGKIMKKIGQPPTSA